MKTAKPLLLALSLLAVGVVSGSAFAANHDLAKPHSDGGSGNFLPGDLWCWTGATATVTSTPSVQVTSSGDLLFIFGGNDAVTSEPCIANVGAPSVAYSGPRASVFCMKPNGDVAYFGVASAAWMNAGAAQWQEEESGDGYVATLPCRILSTQ